MVASAARPQPRESGQKMAWVNATALAEVLKVPVAEVEDLWQGYMAE